MKIVIIDDQIKEVEPIIKYCGLNEYESLYYNGQVKTLPKKQITDFDILFLDIELFGHTNTVQLESSLIAVLKKIVPPKYNRFILFIWSKNYTSINLDNIFVACDFKPFKIINEEKPEYFDHVDDGYIFKTGMQKKLFRGITNDIKNEKAFVIVTDWQKIMSNSQSALINNLISKIPADKKIYVDIITIISKAYLDDILFKKTADFDLVKPFMLEMNKLVIHEVEIQLENYTNSISKADVPKFNREIDYKYIPLKPYLYKNLNTVGYNQTSIMPGTIFYVEENNFIKYIEGNSNHKEIQNLIYRYIEIEISPFCDYYQDKQKEIHKLIEGILIKEEDMNTYNKLINNDGENFESITKIKTSDDHVCNVIINYNLFKSKKNTELTKTANYIQLREELVIYLQNKISKTIMKVGKVSL